MRIGRRSFLVSAAIVIGPGAGMALLGPAVAAGQRSMEAPRLVTEGYRIGPLPPLPRRPYPHTGRYLFADGRVSRADGSCIALWLIVLARHGFAREIPYGLNIETDEQKLWLLGRKTFSPELSKQFMAAHGNDAY